ncbi:MAG: AAA family ATPase [Caldisphaeraceae archaeon]|nr:AAA family ATPase [Caldisphaeraceae archaeon]MEB3691779.1 AAA family ATPase [Caldisphaeraceae archaeon]MEB3798577.1 AAA family ATPase [Caldisphaeraceae archaeon]
MGRKDMMFIIVSGTPGTGKTSVSKALGQDLGCSIIDASNFALSIGAVLWDDRQRNTHVIDEEKLKDGIFKESLTSACVIVATHYPDLFLEDKRFYENTPFAVLLRTNPLELRRRLRKKGWREEKVIENVLAEAFNTVAEDLYPYSDMVIEVDTTATGPVDAVDVIFERLHKLDFGIKVNWLLKGEVVRLASEMLSWLDSKNYRI